MAAAQLIIPAMGRPFLLGALYDTNTNTIINGLKIWSRDEIEDMLQSQSNESMESELVTEISLSDKARNLNLDGRLSLSLLCGTISASGSGKYLTDSKGTKELDSVTYKLDVRTKYEELHIAPGSLLIDLSKLNGATHVVTGIQYGGTALFTFERNKDESKSKDSTSGRLEAQIGKFASLCSVSGSAGLQMTAEERETMQRIRVTYRGDFHLTKPPTNFQESISCIQSIKGADAKSPMKVYLTPLSLLTSDKTAPEPAPLSDGCVKKAIDCYDTLNRALATLDHILANLAPTLWTLVVKQLDASSRELRAFKTSLDDVVSLNSHGAEKQLEEQVVKIYEAYPKDDLLHWIDNLAETSKVLVVISEKLSNIGAEVITSSSQKTRFLMEKETDKQKFMIIMSCPMTMFKFASQKAPGKLWEKPEKEIMFYSEILRLEKLLHGKRMHTAVHQSEKPEPIDENVGMKCLKFENDVWVDSKDSEDSDFNQKSRNIFVSNRSRKFASFADVPF